MRSPPLGSVSPLRPSVTSRASGSQDSPESVRESLRTQVTTPQSPWAWSRFAGESPRGPALAEASLDWSDPSWSEALDPAALDEWLAAFDQLSGQQLSGPALSPPALGAPELEPARSSWDALLFTELDPWTPNLFFDEPGADLAIEEPAPAAPDLRFERGQEPSAGPKIDTTLDLWRELERDLGKARNVEHANAKAQPRPPLAAHAKRVQKPRKSSSRPKVIPLTLTRSSVAGLPGLPEPSAPSVRGAAFTQADGDKLIALKDYCHRGRTLTWPEIAIFFPGRSVATLQSRLRDLRYRAESGGLGSRPH